MSIRSNLHELNRALDDMPEPNRDKAIEMIASVVQLGMKTAGIPQALSDAMEALVMGAIARSATKGQAQVLADVMAEAQVLPHVKAIVRRAGIGG